MKQFPAGIPHKVRTTLAGTPGCNRVGRYILRYHCTSGDHCVVPDGHSAQNGDIGAQPDILPDMDGGGEEIVALRWIDSVVQRGQHRIVADQSAISDGDAPLILESAAAVDEAAWFSQR